MEAVQSWLGHVQDAVVNHQWWPLAALALTGAVAAIRKLTPRIHGKLGAFLNSERGALLLVIVTSIAGALATAFGAGGRPTWPTVWAALKIAAVSAISYPTVRKAIQGWTGIDLSSWTPAKIEEPTVAPAARTKQGGFITIPAIMVIAAIGFVIAILSCGCGPTSAYVVALKTKGTLSDTLLTAYQAWRTYDGVQQDSIIAGNTDRDTALAQLAKWRDGTQHKVDDAFVTARDALATYSSALAAAGAAKQSNWGTAIADATAAVTELLAALKDAGVDVPKPSSKAGRWLAQYEPRRVGNVDVDFQGRFIESGSEEMWARWHLMARIDELLEQICSDPHLENLPLCQADDDLVAVEQRARPFCERHATVAKVMPICYMALRAEVR